MHSGWRPAVASRVGVEALCLDRGEARGIVADRCACANMFVLALPSSFQPGCAVNTSIVGHAHQP
eukprot:9690838-Lingulodinium_polyedra.AAC.1